MFFPMPFQSIFLLLKHFFNFYLVFSLDKFRVVSNDLLVNGEIGPRSVFNFLFVGL